MVVLEMKMHDGSSLAPAFLLLTTLALLCGACGGGGTEPPAPTPPDEAPDEPSPTWILMGDGPGSSSWASDTVGLVSGAGDALAVGGFVGTVTFAPGTPDAVTLTSGSLQDAFFTRTQATDGRLEWAASVAAEPGGYVDLLTVVETPNGVAAAGYFYGDLTFYDAGGLLAGTLASTAAEDGVVVQYDLNGNFISARAFTSPDYVECLALAGSPTGGLVVGGWFDGVMTPPGSIASVVPNGWDGFVASYSPAGALAWLTQFEADPGSSNWVSVWTTNVLAGGDVLVGGDFGGTITFAPGEAHTSVGNSIDSFLARLDGDTGALLWIRLISGMGAEQVHGLGSSTSTGGAEHIRLCGAFEGTATFGSVGSASQPLTSMGAHDGFVAAYDASGALQWVRGVGGSADDYFYDAWVRESDGAVMAVGFFTDFAVISDSPLTLQSHGSGDADALLVGFGAAGTASWARAIGGTGDDYGLGISEVPGVDGDVYASGSGAQPSIFFGPGVPPVPVTADFAAFVVRFAP